jgi:hypothetical protein
MEKEWDILLEKMKTLTGKAATLDALLFLIGVQELGQGFRHFSKEEKQDLMHIGTCKVLSLSGYYQLDGLDAEGWPHWVLAKTVPQLSLDEQEHMLKMHVLEYFEKEGMLLPS